MDSPKKTAHLAGRIDTILSKDVIIKKFEEALDKYPNMRYCLFAMITDDHACHVENAGMISGLEYLGLAQHLGDLLYGLATEEEPDDQA